MELELTLNLSPTVVEKLQQQAAQQQRAVAELASELLTDAVIEQSVSAQADKAEVEVEFDEEALAVIERIKARPLGSRVITAPTEPLGDALRAAIEAEPIDYTYDWAAWQREWAQFEAELKRRDLEKDVREGRRR